MIDPSPHLGLGQHKGDDDDGLDRVELVDNLAQLGHVVVGLHVVGDGLHAEDHLAGGQGGGGRAGDVGEPWVLSGRTGPEHQIRRSRERLNSIRLLVGIEVLVVWVIGIMFFLGGNLSI